MPKCLLLIAKNRENLVEADLLLFTTNWAIAYFSDKLS